MPKVPKDPRSTQRKRARKVLFRIRRPFYCVVCGKSPKNGLPKDAPRDLELGPIDPNMRELQANHINKNIMDNDPVNLEWLCPLHHKQKDMQTEKGVSLIKDEMGYGL